MNTKIINLTPHKVTIVNDDNTIRQSLSHKELQDVFNKQL